VTDSDNDYDARFVLNVIHYSVVTLPNAMKIFARKLFAPSGTRVLRERFNLSDDQSSWLGGETFQLFDCGWLDKKAITCHAASGP
jgi:hypothetical protein